ncbi:C6 transcription factor FacB [Cordyceps fumosorosea ARSEF 2679]|uniref:C6 transcription factor FacB n=1 Tax=Cordyceps fumosorosea (strain ARSEF 2679) TaxID=1081104 RepID=A0A162LDN8_CORFA|nr:C6 transcription factor FacB [Cordyceps fumosorosea ARSEF 2679]OAA69144.1 C6 transcription factor FacB [Cordyceps fumosorosea ARSEF 2679]
MDMDLDLSIGLVEPQQLVDPRSSGVGLSDSCFPAPAPPASAPALLPNGCHSLVLPSNNNNSNNNNNNNSNNNHIPKRTSSSSVSSSLPVDAAAASSFLQPLVWPADLNPFAVADPSNQQPVGAVAAPPSHPPVVPRPCAPAGLTLDVSAAALLPSPPDSIDSAVAVASAASSHFSLGPCFSATSSAQTSPPSSADNGVSPRSRGRPPKRKPSAAAAAAAAAAAVNMSGQKRAVERGGSSGDDSPEHSATGSQGGAKPKAARVERGPEDFSSVVKNRLQSYTRTGQACDRCKVRKIRCDALPEGCSHCINLNLECYVTDRVSGRTERRGYMQELERDKNGMVSHIRQLEKLLLENGVQVRPWQEEKSSPDADADADSAEPPSPASEWAQIGSLWVKNYTKRPSYAPRFPRSKLESRSDSKGTVAGRTVAPLNSMRGTKLTFLGTTIDTSSFPIPDVDEPEDPNDTTPLYNKSSHAFLQTTAGVNPPVQVDLPSRQEAFTYAEWYFMTMGAFLPVLHQPSFMALLARVYDEPEFQPTAAQIAQVHMVFATILFQYGVRNWQQADQRYHLNDLSNKHFHFAISKWHQLLLSRELEAVQALALIVSHVRQFPKLGCGAFVAHAVLQRAIDFNLHRNIQQEGEQTNLTNELRKRLWWSILMTVVAITGRRGYPVPIAVEEIDAEFPEPIADELLTEEGVVDSSRNLPCPFEPAIAGFKITPVFMEVFSNIHSVRGDPQSYLSVVQALEEQLEQWEFELPESLKLSDDAPVDIQSMAPLFMRTYVLEVRLSLRHPGVAMTTDKQIIAENTRICAETGREFLQVAQKIQQLKCLDTTWYTVSFASACIFAMLVAQWEKRFETTEEEFTSLQKDMASWMSILEDIGAILGSKQSIADEIRRIMERTLGWIRHDMDKKAPGTIEASGKGKSLPKSRTKGRRRSDSLPRKQSLKPGQPQIEESPHTAPQAAQQVPTQAVAQAPVGTQAPAGAIANSTSADNKGFYSGQAMATQPTQQNYQTVGYGDAHMQTMNPTGYQADAPPMLYSNPAPADVAPMADSSVQTNPLIAFAPSATQQLPPSTEAEYMWNGRGNTWQDWTAAIADTNDRYGANTLLTLGGGAMPQQSAQPMDSSFIINSGPLGQQGGIHQPAPPGQPWPIMMFDSNNSATTG